jgi:hypothetical protein
LAFKLEATIQEMQKKMEESLKGMAIQNEQQLIGQKQELANLKEMLKSQGISTDLMNMSWTDLIKVGGCFIVEEYESFLRVKKSEIPRGIAGQRQDLQRTKFLRMD